MCQRIGLLRCSLRRNLLNDRIAEIIHHIRCIALFVFLVAEDFRRLLHLFIDLLPEIRFKLFAGIQKRFILRLFRLCSILQLLLQVLCIHSVGIGHIVRVRSKSS